MDLAAAGPVRTGSVSRCSADRNRQARRRRAWFKRARIANQAPIAERNSIELFDVMHRPSIDMRPFARSKNRRALEPIERRAAFVTPGRAATIGRIGSTQSVLGTLSAFCLEGHSPYVAALVPPPCRPLLADCH